MKKIISTLACGFVLLACTDEPQLPTEIIEEIPNEIFMVVEEQPVFEGGQTAWNRYLKNTISYPERALKANVGGRVFLSFIVNTEGKVSNVKLVRGIGYGADEVALKALQESPNWLPAKQRGRKVNAQMTAIVNFDAVSGQAGLIVPKPDTELREIIEVPDSNDDEVYMVVEEQASFRGGTAAWATHVNENLKFPEHNSGIEGRVHLSFVVKKSGELTDVKIVKGIGEAYDQEALKVILNSPNWLPGKQRGQEVDSRMSVAIVFRNS